MGRFAGFGAHKPLCFRQFGCFARKIPHLPPGGEKNVDEAKMFSANAGYKFAGFLDLNGMKEAFSEADAVIARAGSGSIFEIAAFGKPSILIPLEA